jgi:CBS domain-containing protein
MKVRNAMTADVCLVNPGQSLRDAAKLMSDRDIGALPVGENDRLVGMLTDRDIAVRAVAQGLGPDAKVADAMTQEVHYCYLDDDLDDIAQRMGELQVRRMPVLSREDKRLVGVLALGDVAACEDAKTSGKALAGVSTPGGVHSQSSAATQ